MNAGFEESKQTVKIVNIRRVNRNTETIFRVGIYSDTNSTSPKNWSYQCADTNGNGQFDLQIGPGKPSAIMPKVTFRWDPVLETYQSEAGLVGPNFRVIPPGGWEVLRELHKAGKLTYPFDQ